MTIDANATRWAIEPISNTINVGDRITGTFDGRVEDRIITAVSGTSTTLGRMRNRKERRASQSKRISK
jgi:hypothetical protein